MEAADAIIALKKSKQVRLIRHAQAQGMDGMDSVSCSRKRSNDAAVDKSEGWSS